MRDTEEEGAAFQLVVTTGPRIPASRGAEHASTFDPTSYDTTSILESIRRRFRVGALSWHAGSEWRCYRREFGHERSLQTEPEEFDYLAEGVRSRGRRPGRTL